MLWDSGWNSVPDLNLAFISCAEISLADPPKMGENNPPISSHIFRVIQMSQNPAVSKTAESLVDSFLLTGQLEIKK